MAEVGCALRTHEVGLCRTENTFLSAEEGANVNVLNIYILCNPVDLELEVAKSRIHMVHGSSYNTVTRTCEHTYLFATIVLTSDTYCCVAILH